MTEEWFQAVKAGDLEAVRRLAQQGFDVNVRNEDGDSAFDLALNANSPEMAKLLIELGADWRDPPVDPLIDAVRSGDRDAVVRHLERGSDVNAPDTGRRKNGNTALMIAASNRRTDLMEVLLDHGADPTLTGRDDFSALTFAVIVSRQWPQVFQVSEPDPRPLQLLLGAGAHFELREAVLLNDTELARARLDEGADPNTGEWSYFGPLLKLAAELGYPEMVELLLDRGADPDGQDDLGTNALTAAAEAGQIETVAALLDRGAPLRRSDRPCQEDVIGEPALATAAVRDHREIVDLLIARGARRGFYDAGALNEVTLFETLLRDCENPDDSPCDLPRLATVAVRKGHAGIVRRLLDRGAVHYHESDDRHPLLTEAAIHGHADIARLLIERGADLHATGRDGRTALCWALENGHEAVVECLRQSGATR